MELFVETSLPLFPFIGWPKPESVPLVYTQAFLFFSVSLSTSKTPSWDIIATSLSS
jgi:hypothetical protein